MKTKHCRWHEALRARWTGLLGLLFLFGCPQMQPPPGVGKSRQKTSNRKAQARNKARPSVPQSRPTKIEFPKKPKPVSFPSFKSATKKSKPKETKVRRGKVTITQRQKNTPAKANMARKLMAMGAGRRRGGRSIRPVYRGTGKNAPAYIKKLCDAMFALPSRAKGKCCPSKGFMFLFAPQCVRNLNAATQSKAIQLNLANVNRCIKALHKAHQGCDWIGRIRLVMPSTCLRIFKGTLKVGATCRSSLECKKGLHCYGLGSTMAGKCTAPPPNGVRCGAGVDTLATFTRQHNVYQNHPLCGNGYCHRNICRPWQKGGAPCKSDLNCKPGFHCNGTKCVKGTHANPGAPCTGKCKTGSRCIHGKCLSIKKTGERCTQGYECRGGCVPVPGKKIKRCGKQCNTMSLKHFRQINKSKK